MCIRDRLSREQFAAMLHHHFDKAQGGSSEPYEVSLKDGEGNQIEGITTLTWAAYVKPLDKWPLKLMHPDLGPSYFYMYMLQANYSKEHGICVYCHQPSCKARHRMGCKLYRSAHHSRPDEQPTKLRRGHTTLELAASSDPMALAMFGNQY